MLTSKTRAQTPYPAFCFWIRQTEAFWKLMNRTRAIIVGTGPVGLTAVRGVLTWTGIRPIVLMKSRYMGGISRIVNHAGTPDRYRGFF
jgi:hypothetical protein